jgi:tetratricopeptide (TPR) repeat protein
MTTVSIELENNHLNLTLGIDGQEGYNLRVILDDMLMNELLRSRSLILVGIILIILLLSPTPINRVATDRILAAKMAASSGRMEAALSHLEKVLEIFPDNDRFRVSAAEIAFTAGEYNRALHHLSLLDRDLQAESDLICIQAEALLALRNPSQAIEFWKLADHQCPNFAQELLPLVKEYIEAENLEEAENILTILNEYQPLDPSVHFLLGNLTATYAPEEALADLRLADDLSQNENIPAQQLYRTIDDARALENPAYTLACVGRYFAGERNWVLAAQAFTNAIVLQPDYAEAYAYLGLSKDQMGKNGIVELLKAVELAPDLALPHFTLGMHWLAKADSGMALNEFERAVEIDPENPAIIAQIGAAYEATGDLPDAFQAYRAAAEINPQDPKFWLLLAQISLKHEYEVSELALPAARNALVLNPLDASSLDALGYGYYLLGDMNFAEKYLHRAVELDPSLAAAQYHLGLLKYQQDESEAAIAAFKIAQELDSDGNIGFLAQRTLDTLLP